MTPVKPYVYGVTSRSISSGKSLNRLRDEVF